MSDRFIKLLAGVLGVLVVAWAAARLLTGEPGDEEMAGALELPAVAEAELDSVVVVRPEREVRLRGGDGWTVNGYEALPDAGESLSQALEDVRVERLASRNPENHERLGVGEGGGRQLTVYSGGEAVAELIIGDRAGGFDKAYARRADGDRVFVIRGALVNLSSRAVEAWRNKEIVRAGQGEIHRIEYEYPDAAFAISRDSAGWRIEPDGLSGDDANVSTVLDRLAGLRASGFAADSVAGTLSWEEPDARVTVGGPDGTPLAELLFQGQGESGAGYFVRRGDKPVVYTVSQFTANEILKRRDELVAAGGEDDLSEGDGV